MSLLKLKYSPRLGLKTACLTASGKKVNWVRAPAGILTKWICGTSANRVEISISRRSGFQLVRDAPRKLLYRSALSASETGIGGTPSTTRFSLGGTVSIWARPRTAARSKIDDTTRKRVDTFIVGTPAQRTASA